MELTPVEVRVLGCLIEKQQATPQYYPLTLNALVHACNQTSNRSPVVGYDDAMVQEALQTLREKGLTRVVHSVHNRATKYRHALDEALGLERRELAVLGVLALRGPQTAGELRARTERLVELSSDEVDAALDDLATRADQLVLRLERRPGQKETRYSHLLGGAELEQEWQFAAPPRRAQLGGGSEAPEGDEGLGRRRLDVLEAEVVDLREQLHELRGELADLRRLVE